MAFSAWSSSTASVRALALLCTALALAGCGSDGSGAGAPRPADAGTTGDAGGEEEAGTSDAGTMAPGVMDAAVADAGGLDGAEEAMDALTPGDEHVDPPAAEAGALLLFDPSPRATSEAGGRYRFWIYLRTAPSAPVTFTLSVSDEDEAGLLTSSVSFTESNWDSPQQVLVEGKNDAPPERDGDVAYQIDIGPAQSADPAYDGLAVDPVALVNEDDDTPGVSLAPALVGTDETLRTSEAGRSARFSVTLRTRPSAAVTIPLSSSAPEEGTLSVSSLTIEPDAWSSVSWVTVVGVDDAMPGTDGDAAYEVRVGPTRSDDTSYDGLVLEPVAIINEDDDSAGLSVRAEQTPLETSEDGVTVRYVELSLKTRPRGEVRVPVASSLAEEALVEPSELVFDGSNWSVAQRVHVRGVADATPDGAQLYEVRFGPTSSSDSLYDGFESSVPGSNFDLDTPNIVVAYDGELKTDEAGGQASFRISLTAPPAAGSTVEVPIEVLATSGGQAEATLSPLQVSFTPSDYNSPRTVVVSGADDAFADGDQPYFVRIGPAASSDPGYDGVSVPDIALVNEDDDSASLLVTAVGPMVDGRLRLSEPGPSSASFLVRLATEPLAKVTVTLATTDATEGVPTPGRITFVASAPAPGEHLWSEAQAVTVSAVDDDVQDGPVDFFVRVGTESSDPAYASALLEKRVAVRTFDDADSAGLLLGPGSVPPSELTVTEPDGTRTFTVQLTSMPTSAVTIPIRSTDLTEGELFEDGLPLPDGAIVIDPTLWNTPRTLTLSALRDDIVDGLQSYQVEVGPTVSADRVYHNKSTLLDAYTEDGDAAGIVFDELPSGDGDIRFVTSEGGQQSAEPVRLRLTSKPAAPVSLAVTVEGLDPDEATVSPATLTFTEDDWDDPDAHTLVVTGVNDDIDDGDRPYTVVFAPAISSDASYAGLTPEPAALDGLNRDDADAVGIAVSGGPLQLFEEGTTQEIELVLRSEPTDPVTIAVAMSEEHDPPAATLAAGTESEQTIVSLVFTPADWSTPQVVSVTGESDQRRAGHRTISTSFAVTSPDASYDGSALAPVAGEVYDTPRSCKSALALWSLTATETGEWELDTDLDPNTPSHWAHCDMETDGGGWTLLAYSGDTAAYGGVPYPGQDAAEAPYCLVGAGPAPSCTRGSGLPREDLPGLLEVSSELAQGQQTLGGAPLDPYASTLTQYDFAGRYDYGASLAGLDLAYGAGSCTPFASGTYHDVVGTAAQEGTTVFVADALRGPLPSDYSTIDNSYTWSIGSPESACAVQTEAPVSYLGTWDPAQVGPGASGAAGSYSVWIR